MRRSVYGDKGYCSSLTREVTKKVIHLAVIKKVNMKNKNGDLDRFYRRLRFPYKRVFTGERKALRYEGIVKNQFARVYGSDMF